jgi:hypothetical protein
MWNSFKKAFEDFYVFPVTITASKKIDYISIEVFNKDPTKLDDNGKNRLLHVCI